MSKYFELLEGENAFDVRNLCEAFGVLTDNVKVGEISSTVGHFDRRIVEESRAVAARVGGVWDEVRVEARVRDLKVSIFEKKIIKKIEFYL